LFRRIEKQYVPMHNNRLNLTVRTSVALTRRGLGGAAG
jgi:hypothetical protein